MAKLSIVGTHLNVQLSGSERRLLGRPSLRIELKRITGAAIESDFDRSSLGRRISRQPLFGGATGEYFSSAKRLIVLGKRGGGLS